MIGLDALHASAPCRVLGRQAFQGRVFCPFLFFPFHCASGDPVLPVKPVDGLNGCMGDCTEVPSSIFLSNPQSQLINEACIKRPYQCLSPIVNLA